MVSYQKYSRFSRCCNHRWKKVPDTTLTEAACLAATNSKAHLSKQVAVDYTPVKYVKKPAGAKPGMVIYKTNQTAYVDPDETIMERLKLK